MPAEATLPPGLRARRTPGLRREEVAALARVSVSYYERLERARAPRPSPQVLAALATALQLTGAERDYLARLAGQVLPAERDDAPEHVPDAARQLLDRLDGIPAYVVNDRQDIVAWNAAAVALITDFSRLSERNLLRVSLRFRDTLCTGTSGSEAGFAQQTAAQLRTAGVRHPTDTVLAELINEFATHDPDFASAWRNHAVRPMPSVRKNLQRPQAGRTGDRPAHSRPARLRFLRGDVHGGSRQPQRRRAEETLTAAATEAAGSAEVPPRDRGDRE